MLPAVRDIALKAQTRLCARYRALAKRGKKLTVAVTAIARELAGFVWAIGRAMQTVVSAATIARLAHGWGRGNGRGIPALRIMAGIADARSKTGKASDAKTVLRYQTRASEFDHRRLIASPPLLRIHRQSETAKAGKKTRLSDLKTDIRA